MSRTTAEIYLAALLVTCSMNSVLQADELVRQNDFFAADETRHQWVSEYNGRTGMLLVSGALLSSPCKLETTEVALPLQKRVKGMITRYELKLNLLGCGDGGAVTSTKSPAGRTSMMVMQTALLTGVERGVFQPSEQMISSGRAIMFGGKNQLTYWLSEAQQQVLLNQQKSVRTQGKSYMNQQNNIALLHLRLDYE
ncbi:pilus-assembly fibrillin subunit [Edwardsiella anguillarum]|nr:pilus-assembly fibrillin subunit [Edwardsiella anguillarum]